MKYLRNALSEHGLRLRNFVMEKRQKDDLFNASQLLNATDLNSRDNGHDDSNTVTSTNEDAFLRAKEESELLSLELEHLQSAVETVESCVTIVESSNREGACKVVITLYSLHLFVVEYDWNLFIGFVRRGTRNSYVWELSHF